MVGELSQLLANQDSLLRQRRFVDHTPDSTHSLTMPTSGRRFGLSWGRVRAEHSSWHRTNPLSLPVETTWFPWQWVRWDRFSRRH